MPENFPKLMTDPKPQMPEVHRKPSKINAPKSTTTCIVFKLKKQLGNLERSQRGKHLTIEEG